MGVDEGPVELLTEDGLLELGDVPAVDHGDVDVALLCDLHAEGVEHARFGRIMVLVDELSKPGYGHLGDLHRIGVGAGVVCVDGIDCCRVDYAVGPHLTGDHHGDGVGGVSGGGPSHDDDLPGCGRPRSLLRGLRDALGHVPERHSEELRVEPRGPDPHDVELVGVPSELTSGRGVVTGGLAASADHRELHLLGCGTQHLRESGYVIGIIASGDQHGSPDGHDNFVYKDHDQ